MRQMSDHDIDTLHKKLDDLLLAIKGNSEMGIEGVIPRQKKIEKRVSKIEWILYGLAASGVGYAGLTNLDILRLFLH